MKDLNLYVSDGFEEKVQGNVPPAHRRRARGIHNRRVGILRAAD